MGWKSYFDVIKQKKSINYMNRNGRKYFWFFFDVFPAIIEAGQPDQMTWKVPGMNKYTFLLWGAAR